MHSRAPLCERLSPVLNGLQNLTLLRDIELRVYDTDDEENHQEFTCQPDMTCDDKGCQLCPRGVLPVGDRGTTLKWRLADTHTQYGILLATLPQGVILAMINNNWWIPWLNNSPPRWRWIAIRNVSNS